MTSFAQLNIMTRDEWNNSPNIQVKYTPFLMPLLEGLGNVRVHNFSVMQNVTTRDFTLDTLASTKPSIILTQQKIHCHCIFSITI